MYLTYAPRPTYGVIEMLCGLSVGTRLRKPAIIDQFVYFRQQTTKNLWVVLKMIRSNVHRGNHCIIF